MTDRPYDPWQVYEDDDTITVGCHSCGWQSGNHKLESEGATKLAAHREANHGSSDDD